MSLITSYGWIVKVNQDYKFMYRVFTYFPNGDMQGFKDFHIDIEISQKEKASNLINEYVEVKVYKEGNIEFVAEIIRKTK